jgi:hypothetical protein
MTLSYIPVRDINIHLVYYKFTSRRMICNPRPTSYVPKQKFKVSELQTKYYLQRIHIKIIYLYKTKIMYRYKF